MTSIFKSNKISNGHSWTITSKLGAILRDAEEKYGKRDESYTILGIEFTNQSTPKIWYPENNKQIIIQITLACEDNINKAVFQVAHEVIHCLSPTGIKNANVLEEGLATLFSIDYTLQNNHGTWFPEITEYSNALNFMRELISIDPDIIRKIRKIQPTLSMIDKDLILKTNVNVPLSLAESLTIRF